MKKSLLALAVLGAFSGVASAQSSVTMFGVIDVGGRYTKNGDLSVSTLQNDGLQTSRFGVRGVEDIGGGLSAAFWLEAGLGVDAGIAGDATAVSGNTNPPTAASGGTKFWNRRTTVGLIHQSIGELRLGRDYTPTFWGFANYDIWATTGLGSAAKFNTAFSSGALTVTRDDNLVSYLTPALGGFFAQLSYAPGEAVAGQKYAGFQTGYAAGALSVTLSYGQTDSTVADEKYKRGTLGASYDFGVIKLIGFVGQNKFRDQKLDVFDLSFTVPIGASKIRAGYIKANASGNSTPGLNTSSTDANDATQYGIGYQYDVSKRTTLYTDIVQISNKGAANFTVSTPPAAANAAGKKSTGFDLGIRHSF